MFLLGCIYINLSYIVGYIRGFVTVVGNVYKAIDTLRLEGYVSLIILILIFYIILFLLNGMIKKDVQDVIKSEKIEEIRETSKIIIVSINNSQMEGKIWDFDDEHLILKREKEQIDVPWEEMTWIGIRDDN